jgi:hypothetical protein
MMHTELVREITGPADVRQGDRVSYTTTTGKPVTVKGTVAGFPFMNAREEVVRVMLDNGKSAIMLVSRLVVEHEGD